MNAIKLDRFNVVIFAPEVPEDLRGPIEDLGGEILEDVGLDHYADGPIGEDDVALWPHGAEAPDQVLCVARDDPKQFRVYKYKHQIDRAAFVPAGMQHGCYSAPALRKFVASLRSLDAIASHTDESDTPELWEEVARSIGGGS